MRLLRILQDGSFERVGGQRPLHVDVRIVAATHRDLRAMVADGRLAGKEFPSLDSAIRHHIEAALQQTRGRIEGPRGAAALLRINPHTLRAKMRKLRIDWQRFRPS